MIFCFNVFKYPLAFFRYSVIDIQMYLLCSNFQVKYSGTKSYHKNFKDAGVINVGKLTKHTVTGLVPVSNYHFQVYGTSVCGQSFPIEFKMETKIAGKC